MAGTGPSRRVEGSKTRTITLDTDIGTSPGENHLPVAQNASATALGRDNRVRSHKLGLMPALASEAAVRNREIGDNRTGVAARPAAPKAVRGPRTKRSKRFPRPAAPLGAREKSVPHAPAKTNRGKRNGTARLAAATTPALRLTSPGMALVRLRSPLKLAGPRNGG